VAVLLAGGGVQGCCVGPGREPVAVGEPLDVADVGEDPGGHDRSNAVDVHEAGATSEHDGFQLRGGLLDLGLDRDELGEFLGCDAAAGLSGDVTRPDGGDAWPWPGRW
jgi:hypothetical protein